MNIRKLKDCFLTGVLGILIGSTTNITLNALNGIHQIIYLLSISSFILVIGIIFLCDIEKRLNMARKEGRNEGIQWKFGFPFEHHPKK